MQPVFQKIEANINLSFYVEQVKFPYFSNPLQFHPEIEILLVIDGTGTLFVGDSISSFGPGDLVMIGQNVPHVWFSDEKYTFENNNLNSEVIFILFKMEIFGEQFWQLPESKSILKLIQLSQRGIKLIGKTRDEVNLLMRSISSSVGFNRITLLLSILGIIASQKGYQFLASPTVQNIINESDSERLNKVYTYVINNFQQEITLEKAASIACLSIPAFCRYFKKRTNKTFILLLNEIRISHACRLMAEEDFPIAEVCYICGYTNVSYFIRQFRGITGLSPLNYKKKFVDIN
ncbi:MAG: AraC family transcriptional regulator [Bacteroidota bacterium]|nr:AraC family transcriptional regulator [Bacteroidota bacterium]